MDDPASAGHDPGARGQRLLNRDFVLLWQGQLVSQIGNQAYLIAMMYWLMQTTESATLMGIVMMTSMLPGVLLGPIGGTLADRHSRKTIIVASDFVRGIAVLVVAAALFTMPDAPKVVITLLFVVALSNGTATAAFQPALSATIPDLVPAHRVAAANSLNQISVQVAMLLGQATGGVLFRILGAPALFLVDSLSYMFSAISEWFIRVPARRRDHAVSGSGIFAGFVADTMDGMRYVWRYTGMRTLLLIMAAINLLAMPVIVLLPFYVESQLSAGPAWYGFLLAAMGAGSLLGYLIVAATNTVRAIRPMLVICALFAVGVTIVLLGVTESPELAALCFVGMGMSTGTVNVILMTSFQVASRPAIRGRVLSLVHTLSAAVSPVGMALGGILGDVTGKNIAAIYITGGATMILVAAIASSRASVREFLSSTCRSG